MTLRGSQASETDILFERYLMDQTCDNCYHINRGQTPGWEEVCRCQGCHCSSGEMLSAVRGTETIGKEKQPNKKEYFTNSLVVLSCNPVNMNM